MKSQSEKCATFSELHRQSDAFLIPNPWDIGSAKLFEGLGFQALATTSAGVAYALGLTDGAVSLEQKIAHCISLSDNTNIPINVDFENGYATDPERVAENVVRIAETGVAGCSIEDFDRETHEIYDTGHATDRISAAAEALSTLDSPIMLTARAENLLRGVDDLDDTISRLQAFSAAGADVLYAPGLTTLDQVRTVVAAVDKPINVLIPFFRGVQVSDFTAAGASRLSVGSALTWLSVNPLLKAAREMLGEGTFNWTADMASSKEINDLLSKQ